MNILIAAIGFPFSFFLLLMAYWKEDKILEQLGSLSLLIMAMALATGMQTYYVVPLANNTVANYTEVNVNAVSVYEGIFLMVLISVIDLLQYFYFSHLFEFQKRNERRGNN